MDPLEVLLSEAMNERKGEDPRWYSGSEDAVDDHGVGRSGREHHLRAR